VAPSYDITPLGECAVVVRFGDRIGRDLYNAVQLLSHSLSQDPIRHTNEYVPAYATVTIYYDPSQRAFEEVVRELRHRIVGMNSVSQLDIREVEIPVCYGGEYGPDLSVVAAHNSLTIDDVIEIHCSAEYLVYMIGFAPGFPYLGGMPEKIATPRRSTPRLKIPSGSVGIAGAQTGVYPIETPGGWQLIGRTPLSLFRATQMPPTLLRAGDTVRFRPITNEQFNQLRSHNS
jgi:inhibitor of KinA